MTPLHRLVRAFRRIRRRYGFVDHAIRAGLRYDEVDAGRLAAAVTYYAFFAAFGLAVLGLAVLGVLVSGNHLVLDAVSRYLAENLPTLQVDAVSRASGVAGLIGLGALLYAGLRWVDVLRTSVRAIWGLDEHPGNFVVRRLVDLLVLIGLGLLLAISIGIALVVGQGVEWLVVDAARQHGGPGRWVVSAVAFLLGLTVNGFLGAAVLAGLPRLRIPLRRLLPAALVIAAGLEALKTVGKLYIERTASNPAYQVVGGAVGLLLFLNLFNQLLLYATALVATSGHGTAVDLACRPPTEVSELS
ncbi:MAG: YhjD/YihY/BrkB family envelope integrity protein [Actinocatenispora sp.]